VPATQVILAPDLDLTTKDCYGFALPTGFSISWYEAAFYFLDSSVVK
jgi:hypothetical protein